MLVKLVPLVKVLSYTHSMILKTQPIPSVVGDRFDSDIDPFTDEDFDEDAEEIMQVSQLSMLVL